MNGVTTLPLVALQPLTKFTLKFITARSDERGRACVWLAWCHTVPTPKQGAGLAGVFKLTPLHSRHRHWPVAAVESQGKLKDVIHLMR